MKPSIIAQTFTIAALTVLALGVAPAATAESKGCSNSTLKGTFAHTGTGTSLAPPNQGGGLLANVGTETFDGSGTMTAVGFISLNGTSIP